MLKKTTFGEVKVGEVFFLYNEHDTFWVCKKISEIDFTNHTTQLRFFRPDKLPPKIDNATVVCVLNTPEAKTVKDIIIAYLKAHGFDGLCCDVCSCSVDDETPLDACLDWECTPAYQRRCSCGKQVWTPDKEGAALCDDCRNAQDDKAEAMTINRAKHGEKGLK